MSIICLLRISPYYLPGMEVWRHKQDRFRFGMLTYLLISKCMVEVVQLAVSVQQYTPEAISCHLPP